MRIFEGFEGIKGIVRPVVTVGSYDGLHCGHRGILARLKEEATAREGESAVITFNPHPRQVLCPKEKTWLLNTLPEKLALLEEIGIDNVIVVNFTPEFSRIPAGAFIRDWLVGRLRIDTLIVGYNHHWGRDHEGDIGSLQALANELGFRVEEVPRQLVGQSKVSSTVIRALLDDGRIREAVRYLGAPYPIAGVFTEGIMHDIDPDKLLPPVSIYTAELTGAGESFPAVVSVEDNRTIVFRKPRPAPDGVPVTLKFT